jgi:RNA polymerase subunit RPABC4/transcription elongation factor Spt4
MQDAEYNACRNCGEDVTTESDFCPHCGLLFSSAEELECETHAGMRATGVCIVCRSLVCARCSKESGRRIFCLEHADTEVQQDWARVYQSTEINESELVKSVLESSGFRVLVQNFGSVGYAWDGGGDSPQSRSNLSRPAKLFVPLPEYLNAQKAVAEWKSAAAEPE